eukprot:TRINITY_DN105265_c0_g1_i1.p1 TRINITY_DN105265_c0_g1~~TRINITY_DN105265_c0_g1_i1.p1  ORF type:complete len:233 (-),score=37.32 TRINITY_DN105265_c0_g1_i1:79-777(-)
MPHGIPPGSDQLAALTCNHGHEALSVLPFKLTSPKTPVHDWIPELHLAARRNRVCNAASFLGLPTAMTEGSPALKAVNLENPNPDLKEGFSSCGEEFLDPASAGDDADADVAGSRITDGVIKGVGCAKQVGNGLFDKVFGSGSAKVASAMKLDTTDGTQTDSGKLEADEATCNSFALALYHRLKQPAQKLDAEDVSQLIRKYGLCLKGVGLASQSLGCWMGGLTDEACEKHE